MNPAITLIPVKRIKFQGGKRGLAQGVLDLLCDSISKQTLFNAIIVRPDPESPGYYQIVHGRHRYYVVAHLLKRESIECRVFADMSDEEAELAALSDDACRKHATTRERLLLVRKWQEAYGNLYPLLDGKKASGHSRWLKSAKGDAEQKAIDEQKAREAARPTHTSSLLDGDRRTGHQVADGEASIETSVEGPSEVSSEPRVQAVEDQTSRKRARAVTGSSGRTSNLSDGLTEQQVVLLKAVRCTRKSMLKIIDFTPGDAATRGEIVELVASGMEVDRAIAEVSWAARAKAGDAQDKEVGVVEEKAEPETDEEWFQRECGEFAGALSDLDQYHADAILYHRINEARHTFRKSIKKIIEQYQKDRKGKRWGRFFRSLNQIANVPHPNDWKICGECKGKGVTEPGIECARCHGACYYIVAEEYV